MASLITYVMVLAAALGKPQPAGQATSADVELSVAAIEQFRSAASTDLSSAIEPAKNVCRIEMGEAARGLSFTRDGVAEYAGPGREMLTFICLGYLQGAFDVLSRTSAPR